jgi:hypothetical protein
MSDVEALGTPEAPAEAVAPEVGTSEVEAAPAAKYLARDEVADHLVKLRNGDTELEVPFSELESGYLRQSDYTRKTQEIAEQRKALQHMEVLAQELQRNPHQTIAMLQMQLGGQPQAQEPDPYGDDPYGDIFRTYDSELADLRQIANEIRVEKQLGQLQAQVGDPDFDGQAVARKALELQTPDLGLAYKVLFAEREMARQRATTEAQSEYSARQAAADAAIREAKQELAGTVTGGSTQLGGGAPVQNSRPSLEEASRAAYRAVHGS